MSPRFKLPAGGDVSPDAAARRMGITRHAFDQALELLIARGFPAPDPTTGNFDLDAIDAWRRARNPHLFPHDPQPRLIAGPTARNASDVVATRLQRARP